MSVCTDALLLCCNTPINPVTELSARGQWSRSSGQWAVGTARLGNASPPGAAEREAYETIYKAVSTEVLVYWSIVATQRNAASRL